MNSKCHPDPKQTWVRHHYDEESLNGLDYHKCSDRRKGSEIETNRDLDKPVEQLVCDVHEETHDLNRTELQNVAAAQKRMVSMMARVAMSNDKVARLMLYLTWAISIMTAVILVFTVLMWNQSNSKKSRQATVQPST